MSAFFVTGIDTEIGKTFTTVALLSAAREQGKKVLGLKPVAAGAEQTVDGLRNEDALSLIDASNVSLPYEQVNPVCLPQPISPHLSARYSGQSIGVASLLQSCRAGLNTNSDLTLVEGAGGWRVPLNDEETLADFAKVLSLPVILVVGLRLGCLNHACLTAEAILADGLSLAGWVANTIDADMSAHDDNIEYLKQKIEAPMLGHIPFCHGEQRNNTSQFVDINKLMASSES